MTYIHYQSERSEYLWSVLCWVEYQAGIQHEVCSSKRSPPCFGSLLWSSVRLWFHWQSVPSCWKKFQIKLLHDFNQGSEIEKKTTSVDRLSNTTIRIPSRPGKHSERLLRCINPPHSFLLSPLHFDKKFDPSQRHQIPSDWPKSSYYMSYLPGERKCEIRFTVFLGTPFDVRHLKHNYVLSWFQWPP